MAHSSRRFSHWRSITFPLGNFKNSLRRLPTFRRNFSGGQKRRNYASIFETSRLWRGAVTKCSNISEIYNLRLERQWWWWYAMISWGRWKRGSGKRGTRLQGWKTREWKSMESQKSPLFNIVISVLQQPVELMWTRRTLLITALHAMETRYCDENSVRLSVRHTRALWQNGRKICPDLYTIPKNIYLTFLRRRTVG